MASSSWRAVSTNSPRDDRMASRQWRLTKRGSASTEGDGVERWPARRSLDGNIAVSWSYEPSGGLRCRCPLGSRIFARYLGRPSFSSQSRLVVVDLQNNTWFELARCPLDASHDTRPRTDRAGTPDYNQFSGGACHFCNTRLTPGLILALLPWDVAIEAPSIHRQYKLIL